MLLNTVINQNITVDNTLIRTNWFLNLLTWSIGTFFVRMLYKDSYWHLHWQPYWQSDFFSFVLCYSWLFFIFALLIVSGAYDIRLINKYVDICTFCVCQFFAACLLGIRGWISIFRKTGWSSQHISHDHNERRASYLQWTTTAKSLDVDPASLNAKHDSCPAYDRLTSSMISWLTPGDICSTRSDPDFACQQSPATAAIYITRSLHEKSFSAKWFTPGVDWAACLPGTCQVGRLVRRPGGLPRHMLK